MKTLEEVRNIFLADRFASENGAVIEAFDEGYAKCTLALEARHRNAAGGVMGGVPFMLADFAFAVAVNHERMGTVSLASTISYLGAAKGNTLIAEAHCVKEGRSTCYYRVDVTDDTGRAVAEVTINGFHVG